MLKILAILLYLLQFFANGSLIYPCGNNTIGEPVQIVEFMYDPVEKRNIFVLREDKLSEILLNNEIEDNEVMIMSIAGPLRKGKSFFMNLMLQFLDNTKGDPIDKDNIILTKDYGFHWRGGSERDTLGILMWSQPYCIKVEGNKEIAILLMDTQGAFDSEQSYTDTSIIFAISFLTSSVQLYNLASGIQEDNLQNLQVFVEFGKKMSGHNSDHTPFNEMIFLIRDWMNKKEFPYGEIGGKGYMDKILNITENMPESNQELRKGIIKYFEKVQCYLVPHPGLAVAEGDFTAEDITPDFYFYINSFAKWIFNDSLTGGKKVDGKPINSRLFFHLFKSYMDALNSSDLVGPDSIHEAACKANNLISFEKAKSLYSQNLDLKCKQTNSVDENELTSYNDEITIETIQFFNGTNNPGCADYLVKYYISDVFEFINEKFKICQNENNIKLIEECRIRVNDKFTVAQQLYMNSMNEYCNSVLGIQINDLQSYHIVNKDISIENLGQVDKNRCIQFYNETKNQLELSLETSFMSCNNTNLQKLFNECKIRVNNKFTETKQLYTNSMNQFCNSAIGIQPNDLQNYHNVNKAKSIEKFTEMDKDHCKEFYNEVKPQLELFSETSFISCNNTNWQKLHNECIQFNTIEMHNAKLNYLSNMNDICSMPNGIPLDQLKDHHLNTKSLILGIFNNNIRGECPDETHFMLNEITINIDEQYNHCSQNNINKRIQEALRNCHQNGCSAFNGNSCEAGFACIERHSCGCGWLGNCKKRTCCQQFVDGIQIRDNAC